MTNPPEPVPAAPNQQRLDKTKLEAKGSNAAPKHIFISYRQGSEPDQALALGLAERLQGLNIVFIDRTLAPELDWANRLQQELEQADYVIAVLSASAVQSELVAAQLAMAAGIARELAGRPMILPVRLAYTAPFPYPFNSYLEGLPWFNCTKLEELPQLVNDLQRVIDGETSLTPSQDLEITGTPSSVFPVPTFTASLEMPEGTMDPQSAFYVIRASDDLALNTIRQPGVTITLKGPRQMGKSSLLMRTVEEARKAGKRVALLDFQFLDSEVLNSAEIFLRQFCNWLGYTLKLEDQAAQYWRLPLGNVQRCTAYIEDYVLPEVEGPLVVAMDEVDKIFDTPFRSDFFGMLRGWHNRRQSGSVWKKLDLVLVTSTEPYQLVANLNQSPFNVGQVIELEDFTPYQLADLNLRHGSPLTPAEENRLMTLLGGQPYLVRRALYLVANGRLTAAELFASATEERGPFGDHLRYHLFRLHNKPELVEGLLRVIQKQECADEQLFFRLRGAGLVRREGQRVMPRCELYANYFRQHLRSASASLSAAATVSTLANRFISSPPVSSSLEQTLPPTTLISLGLSGRELEVLKLVASGLSNAQVAQKLVISPGTVNVHLSTIYSKLGVGSRMAAVRYAMDHKLI